MARPVRMWIDGKTFNIKPYNLPSNETITNDFEGIITEGRSSYAVRSALTKVPQFYYRQMQPESKYDLEEIAEESETTIELLDEHIKISGETAENVEAALTKIHSIIGHIRSQHFPIQFFNIPILDGEIQENFRKFKQEVLSDKSISNIDESIFQRAEKLHLTLGVTTLVDETEIQAAIEALQQYKLDLKGPLKLRVSGIDCMESSPQKANVLYANVRLLDEQECSLQKIADDLSHYFHEKGFLPKYPKSVKLHMTLINTKYRKHSKNRKYNRTHRITIDATSIIEKFKDYHFGDCEFNSINLSLMSQSGEDRYYKNIFVLKLE